MAKDLNELTQSIKDIGDNLSLKTGINYENISELIIKIIKINKEKTNGTIDLDERIIKLYYSLETDEKISEISIELEIAITQVIKRLNIILKILENTVEK